MLQNLNIFLFAILSLLLFNNCSNEKIIFAFQLNRHGARSPYSGVKNGIDVYKEKWIKNGELTDIGKRQLYLLGVKVRKRYIDEFKLLSREYNPQEIYIRSTDHNRTIESIYSFLQGLYPSGTGPIISDKVYNNKSIIYPPNEKYKENFDNITYKYNMTNKEALPFQMSVEPIHIFYKPKHEFQLYDSDICKGILPIYLELNERQEIKEFANNIINETNNLFIDLEENKNKSYFHDYWNLYKYVDNALCDETDERTFNDLKNKYSYVDDDLLEKLKSKSKKFLKDDFLLTNNSTNLSIVGSSYTMHSILNWMDQAIKSHKNGSIGSYIKFAIFSAHDYSIGNIDGFMNYAFNKTIEYADFAESRYFELYIDDNEQYNVRYLKGDNTIKLDIGYDEFKKIVNNKAWSDEEVAKFCQFDEIQKNNQKENKINILWTSVMIILSVLDGVLLVFLILYCLKKNI